MANNYKKIVLLKGLEGISEYHFKLIKSLLTKELKLNRKTQENCDRITMADLLEEKFPSDSGVGRLIQLFKDIPGLEDLAQTLKKEKTKVQRKSKGKETTSGQKKKQDEPSGTQSTPAKNGDLKPKKAKAIKTTDSERIKEQSQSPESSMTGTQKTQGSSQTSLPLPPKCSSSIKQPDAVPSVSGVKEQGTASPHPQTVKKKEKTTKVKDGEQNLQFQREISLPGTSATSTHSAKAQPQTSPKLPPPPPSSSTAKGKRATKMDDWERNLLSKRKLWLEESSATSTQPAQAQPQTPPNRLPPTSSSSTAKKQKLPTLPKEPSSEQGYQTEPKEVMVLKVTPLFVYQGEKTMFHATVATESEFFRVKVFDVKLQVMFIPNRIIIITEYFGHNGFLEIYSITGVSPGHPEQKLNIPTTLRHNASATPKINYLCSLCPGKCVNGTFLVYKKTVRNECTYYEIQDNTGKMEVVVFGRLTHVDCEEGDKIKLVCFELGLSMDKWQLRSVIHSYMEVIKTRKDKTHAPNPDSNKDTSEQSSIPNYWNFAK
ncbi:PREDICTED: gamma-interferon-inducible protein 16 isoform X1 [Dipodomys ordii]|uniref:Gamma-interferon-inducible protein 16 isoform X1 n=1 Tax=Dipodomys ordii TaxID=10020 RepID=A0A1S3GB94_DIPOR|nr:PREDICTED: gamma-interferon-inducible protein 16 isoform X1 [Dipodomys ordii]